MIFTLPDGVLIAGWAEIFLFSGIGANIGLGLSVCRRAAEVFLQRVSRSIRAISSCCLFASGIFLCSLHAISLLKGWLGFAHDCEDGFAFNFAAEDCGCDERSQEHARDEDCC